MSDIMLVVCGFETEARLYCYMDKTWIIFHRGLPDTGNYYYWEQEGCFGKNTEVYVVMSLLLFCLNIIIFQDLKVITINHIIFYSISGT